MAGVGYNGMLDNHGYNDESKGWEEKKQHGMCTSHGH